MKRKLDFDEVLERLNDERVICEFEVPARILRRKLWIAEWHLPGCLSESRSICLTKEEAVQAGYSFAEDDTSCRGIKSALRKHGFFQHKTGMFGYVNTTITKVTLGELL